MILNRILPLVSVFLIVLPSAYLTPLGSGDEYGIPRGYAHAAILNLTYRNPTTGETISEELELGQFALDSRIEEEWGWVVHILTSEGTHDGCAPAINAPPPGGERWIALIERGACRFHQKIVNAAVNLNASAVVIYDNEDGHLLSMKHKVEEVISVFIRKESGARIATLVDNGTRVLMHIIRSDSQMSQHPSYGNVNRSSVLFVSVSFIVLMMISLAWLVFYYVQRVRYAHTKDRLSKRLMNAAKKALNKMGQRTLRRGDKETDTEFELCAICVESYRPSEIIRVLPCKHIFHKSCVDPWLIEHRTCPICKYDILQAYGLNVMGQKEITGLTNLDASTLLLDSGGRSSSPSPRAASNNNRIPASTRLHSLDPDMELLIDTCPSPVGGASLTEGGVSPIEGGFRPIEGRLMDMEDGVIPMEGGAGIIENEFISAGGKVNLAEGKVNSSENEVNPTGGKVNSAGDGVNSTDGGESSAVGGASSMAGRVSSMIGGAEKISEPSAFVPYNMGNSGGSGNSILNKELAQMHVEPRVPMGQYSADEKCSDDDDDDDDDHSDYDNIRKRLS